ncbi:MAG: outer membrane protein assembly factor BamD [Acidobacteriota bacterium]|nr:outer membrane protein assembly factor BamD [Acidobacteriota bacterium]MDQ2978572.1 outer membrane protein assembly factor BamD [Acidobacteriota bacterium]
MRRAHIGTRLLLEFAAGLSIAVLLGCSTTRKPDKITQELLSTPKETLFEKGKALIARKKYDAGRKYLTFVFETYPNDPLGRQSLLMVADSFFRQGGTTGYTEARFRYRDYLNRYPGAPQRDYARYQFAVCYDREHEKPDRDQTSTREAIEQYRVLLREYPNSGHTALANARIRSLGDLLAEHEFAVGYFYMRKGAPGAALSRFILLEQRFPEYGARDKLFFYSGTVLQRLGRNEEASRYYARLLDEFPGSEFAKKAREKADKLPHPATASVDTRAKSE